MRQYICECWIDETQTLLMHGMVWATSESDAMTKARSLYVSSSLLNELNITLADLTYRVALPDQLEIK